MSQSIRQLAEKFYQLVNTGGDLAEVLSEDFVFGVMPGFPYGGDKHGLAATLEFFDKLGQHFDFWEVAPLRYIEVDDDNLVVTALYRSKATETGRDLEMETVHLWIARDGMLNTYKHYCDTALLSTAMDHKVPQ
jgi:ketosteroid isomerase-like protein